MRIVKIIADKNLILVKGGRNDRTGGTDGWVSMEVSPLLANDTQATIDAALRIHKHANRPNLYVKIPVKMEIRGTYHQVAKFFKNTSELRRIVNVENLALSPERNATTEQMNAPTRMHAKFVAATFRFKEGAVAAAGEAK